MDYPGRSALCIFLITWQAYRLITSAYMIWHKAIALVSIEMVPMLILDELWHSGTASRASWRHLQHQQWTDVRALERPALLHSSPNHKPWLQELKGIGGSNWNPNLVYLALLACPDNEVQRNSFSKKWIPSFEIRLHKQISNNRLRVDGTELRCDGNSGLHVCKHAIAAIITLVLPEELLALL